MKEIKSDILVHQKVVYEDIYENVLRQKNVTTLFSQLVKIKKSKSEKNSPSTLQSSCEVLKNGDNLQSSCNNHSFGK